MTFNKAFTFFSKVDFFILVQDLVLFTDDGELLLLVEDPIAVQVPGACFTHIPWLVIMSWSIAPLEDTSIFVQVVVAT